MSRSLSRWQALVLGFVIIVGGVSATCSLFAVGSRGWYGNDSLHVRAAFPSIRGVEVGTRVRVQGLDAGEVVSLVPPENSGDPVTMRIRLHGKFRHLVMADSSVRIVSEGMIGGKVVEIVPAENAAHADSTPVAEDQMLAAAPSIELADVLSQVNSALSSIQDGKGTLGQLANNRQAYDELVALLKQGTDTMVSVQRDAEALKKVPVIRGYVEDSTELLVRPHCVVYRRFFPETDLFDTGRATLTASGKERLDELSSWLGGLKQKGSEVVVATYADPQYAPSAAVARTLTRKQSDAVVEYLTNRHSVHKLGWFSSRKVIPVGQGINRPPLPESEPMPPARVEVMVFVPEA